MRRHPQATRRRFLPAFPALFLLAAIAAQVLTGTSRSANAQQGVSEMTAPIRTHLDIPYLGQASDDTFQILDIYTPASAPAEANLPVLFFIHGGAFWMSDKRDPDYYPERIYRALAAEGLVVVAPNYRLTPAVRYPAHAEDTAAALAWTIDHVAGYGGDPDRILVSGHSAGGFLAAAIVLDTRFLAAHGTTASGIRGVIPICGQFDVVDSGRQDTFGTDRALWPGYSPLNHVRSDAPPFTIIEAAGDDWWAPGQAEIFHEALRRAGVTSIFYELDDDHFTVIRDIGRESDDLTPLIRNFIRP